MPRLEADFDDTEPGAVGDYTINFGTNVPDGITILTAPWSLAARYVAPGYTLDPDPSARLDGTATIDGTAVTQRIGDLYAGNTYLVTVTATLSDGEIVILWCTLSCVAPA